MKKGILVLMIAVAFGVGVCGCSKRSDAPSDQPSETRDPNDPGPSLKDFPEPSDDLGGEESFGGESDLPAPPSDGDNVVVEPIEDDFVDPAPPIPEPEVGGNVPPAVDETTDFEALGEEVERLINQ